MRLQFTLDKITIHPACHFQLVRQADEYLNGYAAGQLYGELYDDAAHVTNVLQFPEPEQMSTKEQLQLMEARHKDMLNNFNMDTTNLGWFMVCYHENYWDSLEAVKYYEKYINTSFFLVYDYQARLRGKNPYKGFRLTDEFIGKQQFTFSELLQARQINQRSPFLEIPVQLEKNEIFQLMMLHNKKNMVQELRKKHETKSQVNLLKQKVQNYMATLEQTTQSYRGIAEKIKKDKDEAQYSEFCHYLGHNLKASHQQQSLKQYEQNLNTLKEKFQGL